MEQISISNNVLTFNGNNYAISGASKIDAVGFLLHTDNGSMRFELNDTELNGVILTSFDDLFAHVPEIKTSTPNWNGLTQALAQSALMGYALGHANPNGFSLFLKTLTDGENNSASENFLLMTITACGLSLSTDQKTELNGYLSENNFTIRVS